MIDVIVPELGEEISAATIAGWLVKVGDAVTPEHDIVELVTDKAVFNVPSPGTGTVKEILFSTGESVEVGKVVARIEEQDE